MKRAEVISMIVRSLCQSEICPEVEETPINLITPKMPAHTYAEVNKLVSALKLYTEKVGIQIPGGVATAPISRDFITPRLVSRASGILLADLIAVRHEIGDTGDLQIPTSKRNATPTHVWQKLNSARRYLEKLPY